MRDQFSTVEAAFILNVRPGTLAKAVWDRRVSAPPKGPGSAYHWRVEDIVRASFRLHGHALSALARGRLAQVEQGATARTGGHPSQLSGC